MMRMKETESGMTGKNLVGFLFSVLILSISLAAQAGTLEVRVHPGDFVYSYEVEPAHSLYSAMVQNIAVLNSGEFACTLESVELQSLAAGQPTASLIVGVTDLDTASKKVAGMNKAGLLKLYDFHLQTSRYLPENVTYADTRAMNPGSAILLTSRAMLVGSTVDQIAIIAKGTSADGKPVEARTTVQVRQHASKNNYHFPVAGTWYVGAAPSLQGHHRWAANQEFALDLVLLGANSKTHGGEGGKLSDYFDYGKDVLAIADGVVVAARSDAPESDSNLQQPGESSDAYEQRTVAQQNELLMKGYLEPIGNYVVIRHDGEEYSNYAHLRTGSVKVKKGDVVKQGQIIGQLGHSGNSTEPHLHFQIVDGPDPMFARGIPITFSNIRVEAFGYEDRPLQSGWIVTTK